MSTFSLPHTTVVVPAIPVRLVVPNKREFLIKLHNQKYRCLTMNNPTAMFVVNLELNVECKAKMTNLILCVFHC